MPKFAFRKLWTHETVQVFQRQKIHYCNLAKFARFSVNGLFTTGEKFAGSKIYRNPCKPREDECVNYKFKLLTGVNEL